MLIILLKKFFLLKSEMIKKISILFLLIIFSSLKLAAYWQLNLSLGASLPRINFSQNFLDVEQKNPLSFLFSGQAGFQISEKFWFALGARLEKRSAEVSVLNGSQELNASYKTSYLIFPFSFIFRPNIESSSIFFQAGIDLMFLLSNKIEADYFTEPINLKKESRKSFIAPLIGIGYIFELETNNLQLALLWSLKGAKIYRELEEGKEYFFQSSAIFLSFGYTFDIF